MKKNFCLIRSKPCRWTATILSSRSQRFLTMHGIEIEEVSGSSYQAPYIATSVFSTKFIVLIPPEVRLLSLREEFLDFCDQLNIDAILEPIKR